MAKAIGISISMKGGHLKVLDRWVEQAESNRSEVIKLLIEANSDRNLVRDGLFWRFEAPAWRRAHRDE
jgi:hypothetical protein